MKKKKLRESQQEEIQNVEELKTEIGRLERRLSHQYTNINDKGSVNNGNNNNNKKL